MNRTQMIKQAYVRGLAARGILRMRAILKQAAIGSLPVAGPEIPGGGLPGAGFTDRYKSNDPVLNAVFADGKPAQTKGWSRGATNAIAGLGGAGIGAIIGALIAYARKKKVLGHALAGAGIGGLAGVGGNELYRYLSKKPETSADDIDWGSTQRDAAISDILNNPMPDEPLGTKLDATAFKDYSGLA